MDWLKLNAGQTGLYRVHYPDELWERLTLVAARVIDDVPIMPEVHILYLGVPGCIRVSGFILGDMCIYVRLTFGAILLASVETSPLNAPQPAILYVLHLFAGSDILWDWTRKSAHALLLAEFAWI